MNDVIPPCDIDRRWNK